MNRDRTSRTLTARQLIEKLSRVDPDLPVVFTARDEPLGDYGVRSMTVREMQRENIFAGGHYGADVFHDPSQSFDGKPKTGPSHDEPQMVVLLDHESPWEPTIDAEVIDRQVSLPTGQKEIP